MSNQWYDVDSWQWVDSESSQWGFTTDSPGSTNLRLLQIWTDESYVYAATTSGLDIIDLETEQRAHFLSRQGGYTSVW